MGYQVGDYIFVTDESAVYKIDRLPHEYMDMYRGKMVGDTFSRGFEVNATHYRMATDQEIQEARDNALQLYPFWICDDKDEIISTGTMRAVDYKHAETMFRSYLKKLTKELEVEGLKLGDYGLSDESETVL